jgi:hypothetical protein
MNRSATGLTNHFRSEDGRAVSKNCFCISFMVPNH